MEVASVAAELANEIVEGVPAEDEGRDLLAELASQIDRKISSANKRLAQLTKGRV